MVVLAAMLSRSTARTATVWGDRALCDLLAVRSRDLDHGWAEREDVGMARPIAVPVQVPGTHP